MTISFCIFLKANLILYEKDTYTARNIFRSVCYCPNRSYLLHHKGYICFKGSIVVKLLCFVAIGNHCASADLPGCTTPCRGQIVQHPLLRTGGESFVFSCVILLCFVVSSSRVFYLSRMAFLRQGRNSHSPLLI